MFRQTSIAYNRKYDSTDKKNERADKLKSRPRDMIVESVADELYRHGFDPLEQMIKLAKGGTKDDRLKYDACAFLLSRIFPSLRSFEVKHDAKRTINYNPTFMGSPPKELENLDKNEEN